MAKITADAVMGATYAVGTIGLDDGTSAKVGALHAVGKSVDDCVFCVKTGQQVTLTRIPLLLQRKFALGETAVATFKESEIYHRDDILDFGNGKRFHLRVFEGQGIELYVGEKHDTSKVVAGIIADAATAASQASAPQDELVTAR
ncbi:MAG: hypothetical protein ACYCZ0_04205 [Minisyncoccota bacterium]